MQPGTVRKKALVSIKASKGKDALTLGSDTEEDIAVYRKVDPTGALIARIVHP